MGGRPEGIVWRDLVDKVRTYLPEPIGSKTSSIERPVLIVAPDSNRLHRVQGSHCERQERIDALLHAVQDVGADAHKLELCLQQLADVPAIPNVVVHPFSYGESLLRADARQRAKAIRNPEHIGEDASHYALSLSTEATSHGGFLTEAEAKNIDSLFGPGTLGAVIGAWKSAWVVAVCLNNDTCHVADNDTRPPSHHCGPVTTTRPGQDRGFGFANTGFALATFLFLLHRVRPPPSMRTSDAEYNRALLRMEPFVKPYLLLRVLARAQMPKHDNGWSTSWFPTLEALLLSARESEETLYRQLSDVAPGFYEFLLSRPSTSRVTFFILIRRAAHGHYTDVRHVLADLYAYADSCKEYKRVAGIDAYNKKCDVLLRSVEKLKEVYYDRPDHLWRWLSVPLDHEHGPIRVAIYDSDNHNGNGSPAIAAVKAAQQGLHEQALYNLSPYHAIANDVGSFTTSQGKGAKTQDNGAMYDAAALDVRIAEAFNDQHNHQLLWVTSPDALQLPNDSGKRRDMRHWCLAEGPAVPPHRVDPAKSELTNSLSSAEKAHRESNRAHLLAAHSQLWTPGSLAQSSSGQFSFLPAGLAMTARPGAPQGVPRPVVKDNGPGVDVSAAATINGKKYPQRHMQILCASVHAQAGGQDGPGYGTHAVVVSGRTGGVLEGDIGARFYTPEAYKKVQTLPVGSASSAGAEGKLLGCDASGMPRLPSFEPPMVGVSSSTGSVELADCPYYASLSLPCSVGYEGKRKRKQLLVVSEEEVRSKTVQVMKAIVEYRPHILLHASGLDAVKNDRTGSMNLRPAVMGDLAAMIYAASGFVKVACNAEGGYGRDPKTCKGDLFSEMEEAAVSLFHAKLQHSRAIDAVRKFVGESDGMSAVAGQPTGTGSGAASDSTSSARSPEPDAYDTAVEAQELLDVLINNTSSSQVPATVMPSTAVHVGAGAGGIAGPSAAASAVDEVEVEDEPEVGDTYDDDDGGSDLDVDERSARGKQAPRSRQPPRDRSALDAQARIAEARLRGVGSDDEQSSEEDDRASAELEGDTASDGETELHKAAHGHAPVLAAGTGRGGMPQAKPGSMLPPPLPMPSLAPVPSMLPSQRVEGGMRMGVWTAPAPSSSGTGASGTGIGMDHDDFTVRAGVKRGRQGGDGSAAVALAASTLPGQIAAATAVLTASREAFQAATARSESALEALDKTAFDRAADERFGHNKVAKQAEARLELLYKAQELHAARGSKVQSCQARLRECQTALDNNAQLLQASTQMHTDAHAALLAEREQLRLPLLAMHEPALALSGLGEELGYDLPLNPGPVAGVALLVREGLDAAVNSLAASFKVAVQPAPHMSDVLRACNERAAASASNLSQARERLRAAADIASVDESALDSIRSQEEKINLKLQFGRRLLAYVEQVERLRPAGSAHDAAAEKVGALLREVSAAQAVHDASVKALQEAKDVETRAAAEVDEQLADIAAKLAEAPLPVAPRGPSSSAGVGGSQGQADSSSDGGEAQDPPSKTAKTGVGAGAGDDGGIEGDDDIVEVL